MPKTITEVEYDEQEDDAVNPINPDILRRLSCNHKRQEWIADCGIRNCCGHYRCKECGGESRPFVGQRVTSETIV
jgi:hypothetical protein